MFKKHILLKKIISLFVKDKNNKPLIITTHSVDFNIYTYEYVPKNKKICIEKIISK